MKGIYAGAIATITGKAPVSIDQHDLTPSQGAS